MRKSVSGFCGALILFLTSSAFAGGLSEGLLLHYPFDRDEGPVLTDASGSGRFGWAHGATWVAEGARGGGCRFDSNRQYVVADDAGLPSGDAPRTMALWIKLDKLAPDPVTALLTYGQGTRNHMSGIGLDWRVGRANLYFTQCGGVALSQWRMEKPGSWHHLAYVYEGKGQHRFYVDGQPGDGMSELRGPIDTQLSGAVIVGADPTGTGPVGGVLDDVRIYGRALSEKEIAELVVPEKPKGPVVHYTFDKDEGGIVTDDSGNGRMAEVDGATWVKDGARGGAYRFDKNSQSIRASDAGLPSGDAPRTMALWIKLDKLESEGTTGLFTYGTYRWNQASGVGMDWRLDRDRYYFSQNGACFLTEQKLEKPGTWHHLAYTYGGNGDHHLYVDGAPSDGMSELGGPINTVLSGLLLLGGHPGSIGPNGGSLDDVRIYDRVLTAEEIAELAEGDPPSADADTDGDGYSDALEIARGSDPLDPESVPQAATFYVDASRPDDAGDAASWATAKQTIQAGVDLAVLEGDVVLVNDGIYETGNRATPGCQLQNRVLITNEITVRSVNGPEATMIRGQGPRGTNAVRCAYMTAGNLIGFTLANGHTRMDGDGNGDQNGGGLSVSVSNRVVVSNCIFLGNSAYNAGGAIFGTFYNCVMNGNSAARAGGAVCCATLYNCEISGNSATYYGGAADQCRFYNCTVTGNSAESGGGVYHCMVYNSIVVSNRPANVEWVTCRYSCVDPLQAGEGNLADDPKLVSGRHLAPDSPCVGAGSAAYAFGTDLDGETWRNPPSIGCDEVVLSAGPIVHYTFDKDEGGIVADDSGNGRTAKVDGATWVKDGARGGAYRFDDNSQAITATDAGLPSGDAPRSIALWMKIDTNYPGGCTGMLGYGTDNFSRQFSGLGFDWRLDRDCVYFSPGGACFLTARKLPEPGTWIHVAYTYGGNGDHHLYFNGEPSDGMSELWGPVNTLLSGVLRMGGHPGNPGPDGGYVDDVRIYGRVLSEKEIAELAVGSFGESDPREDSGSGETDSGEEIEFQMIGRDAGVAGTMTIQWACEPGVAYDLYWTDDLTKGFTMIASGLVSDGAEMAYTNALAGARTGFYRVALH